ncbi:MAG: VWA domain-containing protein [Ectothiorhodospiraceae bacterium]|nr:VWA domain-containing protein [Chromatiales bacterium]MCP5155462.1 VWA domain-containing protein [Ectothiorhodospiraceae bacterium]
MLILFFQALRASGIPVSITEFLALLDALAHRLAGLDVEDFYWLARTILVKDERWFDRYDRIFAAHFEGLEATLAEVLGEVPEEWLRKQAERVLDEEERKKIEALGGFEALMRTLAERLAEQSGRHQGGSKWIGTAGTSPFGAYGYNPEGVRIGQDRSRNRRAVKVWDRREYRNFDDSVELGTRNIKLALRRLRRFAREGVPEELDLDRTIGATARNAGLLDVHLQPERRNAANVLLFLDVGGSMDDHIAVCEQLFSAARSEFKHLEHFYFHNFVYESVWKDNRRRHGERIPTMQVLNTYGRTHNLIMVGDATMSPYEIVQPGGSVEHWNEEPGAVWMERLLHAYPRAIWLNPEPRGRWERTPSITITRELMSDRMFPLTLEGLEQGIRALRPR